MGDQLPSDLTLSLFSDATIPHLHQYMLVCKQWYRVIHAKPELFWFKYVSLRIIDRVQIPPYESKHIFITCKCRYCRPHVPFTLGEYIQRKGLENTPRTGRQFAWAQGVVAVSE